MKYYSSYANETVIVANLETDFPLVVKSAALVIGLRKTLLGSLSDYLYDGNTVAGRRLCHELTSAEFRMIVGLRKFWKRVTYDTWYRSPRFWINQGSYIMLHLNVGWACVIIDNRAS